MPLLALIYPALLSAGAWLLRVVFAGAVIKACASFFIFFTLEFLIAKTTGLMPLWFKPSTILEYFSVLTGSLAGHSLGGFDYVAAFWYFARMASVPFGFITILNAYITRFIIRRIFH